MKTNSADPVVMESIYASIRRSGLFSEKRAQEDLANMSNIIIPLQTAVGIAWEDADQKRDKLAADRKRDIMDLE